MASKARKMRTIETTATVTKEGTLTVQVPNDIPPGVHTVLVVIETTTAPNRPRLELAAFDLSGAWPTNCRFSCEDLYGDDGR